jgi:hypothetical protein
MSSESERQRWREAKRRQRIRKGGAVADLGELLAAADLPERPSRDELLAALGVRAREGSVPAIRLLLEEYRREGEGVIRSDRTGSAIDELAARRSSE